MSTPLRVLIVEDSNDDAALVLRALKANFPHLEHQRVDSREGFLAQLGAGHWDALIVDHHLPSFDAFSVLQIVKAAGLDVPIIVVSGSIGEDVAVATMRAGAADYVMKSNLPRLGPALERELREAEARRKQRKAEEALRNELESARAMLYVSDRMVSMGTLAAGVAHEINNPLAAMIADLEFVSRVLVGDTTEDTVEVLAAVRNAREAAQSIRQIVSDLKIFSRPDEEQRDATDPQHALDSALRMAWNEISHRARIVKDYGPTPMVEANPARIGQVFLNLLVNAAQAMDDRGPGVKEICIRTATDAEGWATVEVRDSGQGIPPGDLKRIFDPFFTTKPVGVGTGLGLFVCHRIISELGGELTVESEVGRGSMFRVRLKPAATDRPETKAKVPVALAPRRGKVMVVDDERMIGSAVRRTLEAEHDVTVFTSAREALAVLKAGQRFDVILCDLMMPQMTGMELHAEASIDCPDQAARIVFLTGGAFTPQSQDFLERVNNPHLEKPFDTTHLRALVNGHVR